MLSGEKEPDKIANLFLSIDVKTVVLNSAKGLLYKIPQDSYCIPTYTRYNAVDTTGAAILSLLVFSQVFKGWGLYQYGVLPML